MVLDSFKVLGTKVSVVCFVMKLILVNFNENGP